MRHGWLAFCSLVFAFAAIAPAADEPAPLTPAEAAKMVDKDVTVQMEVKSAMVRGEVGFLNSEKNHKDEKNFTIFLGSKTLDKFKDAKIDDPAAHFKGKTVIVKGKVTLHMDKPQIILDGPASIKIVDEKAEAKKAA